MKPATAAGKIIKHIRKGNLDSFLESINRACIDRLRYVRETERLVAAGNFNTEDPIRIGGLIKPKYLVGHTGSVIAAPDGAREKPGYVWVYLDIKPRGRYGQTLHVPANCLQKID